MEIKHNYEKIGKLRFKVSLDKGYKSTSQKFQRKLFCLLQY